MPAYTLSELKEMKKAKLIKLCKQLGIDYEGKKKSTLIRRIRAANKLKKRTTAASVKKTKKTKKSKKSKKSKKTKKTKKVKTRTTAASSRRSRPKYIGLAKLRKMAKDAGIPIEKKKGKGKLHAASIRAKLRIALGVEEANRRMRYPETKLPITMKELNQTVEALNHDIQAHQLKMKKVSKKRAQENTAQYQARVKRQMKRVHALMNAAEGASPASPIVVSSA